MEDVENAHSSAAAKGNKEQVVESSEIQISPTTPLRQRIAERLETWGVESRGTMSLFAF